MRVRKRCEDLFMALYKIMFTVKQIIGQHTVYAFDTQKHPFLEYVRSLYQTDALNQLHQLSPDYQQENISDVETELHQRFYQDIKARPEFKRLYCAFLQDIHRAFFPEEEFLIYQSFPSIRIQWINNVTVPPHYDSDDIGRHPLGEKNFLLPLTEMVGTKRLFIESEPGKGDFQGITMNYGDLLFFNGNRCTHYNEKNVEDSIRISLDFRVILRKDYLAYVEQGDITMTNPRDPEKKRVPTKMIVGGYYQITRRDQDLDSMMIWTHQTTGILQTRPLFGEQEAKACYTYLANPDHFYTEFKKTEELEKALCAVTGSKHCIMTVNGNIALILALMALGIQNGDEVIVPNYTMIASINSVTLVGATPVLVDVDPDTLTLSTAIIDAARTSRTKAIMHVSLNNRSQSMMELARYCKEHGLLLLEDAAQSLGCKTEGQHYGTFGDIGCFSFSTPKIISTGQGGCVVTDRDDLAQKMRKIKNFGRISGGMDVFDSFGINFKFTDVQAVIGLEQLKKLPERVVRMRQMFDLYYDRLHSVAKMITPQEESWIPWFVDLFTPRRDALIAFLAKHHVQTRATYPEIHRTPMYSSEARSDAMFPVSQHVSAHGLFLPSHLLLTDRDIHYVCDLIQLFLSP